MEIGLVSAQRDTKMINAKLSEYGIDPRQVISIETTDSRCYVDIWYRRGTSEKDVAHCMQSCPAVAGLKSAIGAERPRVTCRDSAKPRPAGQRRTRRKTQCGDKD